MQATLRTRGVSHSLAQRACQRPLPHALRTHRRGCMEQRRGPPAPLAFFGIKWPFSSEEGKGEGNPVLKAARAARRGGCQLAPAEAPPGLKLATVAGGCFWGLELAYQRVPGVVKTSVGYTGGKRECPTYEEVCMGVTGHTEAVQITYDPNQVTYRQLLDVFFDRVDPTTKNRQGNDRGTQYRSGIYWHDPSQRAEAEAAVEEVNARLAQGAAGRWLGKRVVTELGPAGDYYLAEAYHQQYLERGGRLGMAQSAAKGCTDKIRCYG